MTGKKLGESSRQMLLEICAGIALYCIAGEAVICFLPIQTAPSALAYLLGCAVSAGVMIHITYVTELVLDMNSPSEAQKYTTVRYLLRYFVIIVVVLIVYFTGYLNMAALFIGMLGIKAGAYLQPSMHRFLEWAMGRR